MNRSLNTKPDTPSAMIRARLADGTLVEGTVAEQTNSRVIVSGDTNGMSVGDELVATILLVDYSNRTFRGRVKHIDKSKGQWRVDVIPDDDRNAEP